MLWKARRESYPPEVTCGRSSTRRGSARRFPQEPALEPEIGQERGTVLRAEVLGAFLHELVAGARFARSLAREHLRDRPDVDCQLRSHFLDVRGLERRCRRADGPRV